MKTQISKNLQAALLAGALLGFAAVDARADGPGPNTLPPQSHPYGESYGQWAADWWTWALSIPPEINPLSDTTGAFAGVGQHGPVWFLAGAAGNGPLSATRNVTIPDGKALFFPIVNTLWWTSPTDSVPVLTDILSALAGVTADINNVSCTIDGVAVKHLEKFITISPVFSFTAPTDTILGLPLPGVYTPDVDEGYYLMLAPLSPGSHTIHFTGNNVDLGYSLDITYNLKVQKAPHDGGHD